MVSSIARSTASGSTAVFSVPFPYLDKTHVQVRLNGVLKTLGVDYTFPTASTIQITAGNPDAGTVVERKRVTPTDPLTSFTPGNLDTGDLNVGILQPLYLAQEAADHADDLEERGFYSVNFADGGLVPLPEANKVLGWNAAGTALENKALLDMGMVQVSALWQSILGLLTFAEAWLVLKLNGSLSTRALIKALTPQDGMSVLLTEPGRVGNFVWRLGDYSAQIALDTAEGVYLKADSVDATVGAWVRDFSILNVEHFGASASASRSANRAAIQCAVNVAQAYAGSLLVRDTYLTDEAVTQTSAMKLWGYQPDKSGISSNSGPGITITPTTSTSNDNTWWGWKDLLIKTTDVAHFGLEYASSGSEYMSNWEMRGCKLSGPLGGASFDSSGSTVGIFKCLLTMNWFDNGLVIKDGGDSIHLIDNEVNGAGIGIFVNGLKAGARQLVIRDNNIAARSECVYLLNVTGAEVDHNWMETPSYLGSYTGTTGALLYAQACSQTFVQRNTIQPLASAGGGFVPAAYSIRFNTSGDKNVIERQDLIAIGGTGHIQIGAGVTNTYIREDNKFDVTPVITDAGTGTFGAKSNTPGVWKDLVKFTTATAFGTVVQFESTDAGAGNGPFIEGYRNSASPAASDGGPVYGFYWNSALGVKTLGAYFSGTQVDPTDATFSAAINFVRKVSGADVTAFSIGATFAVAAPTTFAQAITPLSNDAAALGSATVSWADLFLASGGVINFANGNYTITHSAGTLTLSGILVASQYNVGGNQVVGARQTGWTAGTGTANKGSFAAYAGQTHTGSYVQATVQALDDAARNASQRVKAIEDALRAHGLIN